MITDLDSQFSRLTKGCVDIVTPADLRAKLERSIRTGTPLVVKVGFDPTAPDLHLGHVVLIRKMKDFQDLGHTVVFVVGDFTGMIGDPSGRSKTRPPMSREEIERNAETYKTQVFKILDPKKTMIRFNSEWLRELGSEGFIRLGARYNVAQMLERRDFKQRYESGQPIAIHEFLYSLAQAYDSVALKADAELGGTDQLFNLNVGRDIMPSFGLEPQLVMTTPLLEGLDGKEKMSKSAGNYVGVTEPPNEMFGKLMSISDELMWRYYQLLTDLSADEIDALRARVASGDLHPKQAKVDLARRIVADFHSPPDADAAAEEFERVFGRGELGTNLPERPVYRSQPIERVLVDCGLAESSSDAFRKVQQGAVRINGHRFTTSRAPVGLDEPFAVQVGRHAVKAVVVHDEDVLVSPRLGMPGEWTIIQGHRLVGEVHPTREAALSHARQFASQSGGRLWLFEGDRMNEIAS